ncbi:MAG: 30S ribosomal protein S6 [Candidatus Margulisiibacteriota bacterium]
MKYELVIIVKADYTEEKVDAFLKKYETLINASYGQFLSAEKWGRRQILTEFQRKQHGGEGYYVMISFEGTKPLDKLTYSLKIDDEVIRHLISREVIPPKPIEKAS